MAVVGKSDGGDKLDVQGSNMPVLGQQELQRRQVWLAMSVLGAQQAGTAQHHGRTRQVVGRW